MINKKAKRLLNLQESLGNKKGHSYLTCSLPIAFACPLLLIYTHCVATMLFNMYQEGGNLMCDVIRYLLEKEQQALSFSVYGYAAQKYTVPWSCSKHHFNLCWQRKKYFFTLISRPSPSIPNFFSRGKAVALRLSTYKIKNLKSRLLIRSYISQ